MSEPHFDARLELPPGEYQAEVAAIVEDDKETTVYFRLTDPPKDHPQAGLGGRIARAWFDLQSVNPVTAAEEERKAAAILQACDAVTLKDCVGSIVRIRVARQIRRSDPSRYRTAVVEVLPLADPNVKGYVS
jgi:hypothetical protein